MINAPTVVEEVMRLLRLHRQPVTLFAENAFDRRERLKKVLATSSFRRRGQTCWGKAIAVVLARSKGKN